MSSAADAKKKQNKSAGPKRRSRSGFPVLVRIEEDNSTKVLRSSADFEKLSGVKFKILERDYVPGRKGKRKPGNQDQIDLPKGAFDSAVQHRKLVDIITVTRHEDDPESDGGKVLYVDGCDEPVRVSKVWWEKNRPRNPNFKFYLVNHRNGHITGTVDAVLKHNFTPWREPTLTELEIEFRARQQAAQESLLDHIKQSGYNDAKLSDMTAQDLLAELTERHGETAAAETKEGAS